MLQEARSSFSDELSRNFPRSQGGRTANQRPRSRAGEQTTQMSVICLPQGSSSVPSHSQLVSMTNSGSGYGYPVGSNAAGSIDCPINFSSQDELLQHLRGYFSSLSGNTIPCSFYKRTQGLRIRKITFSSFRELRQAVGRGALVIVPDSMPGPGNGNVMVNTSHNQQSSIRAAPQTSTSRSVQAGPHQISPHSLQPVLTNPMTPTGSQPTLFCQPQQMNASSAVPLAAARSSFPTVHGFPLPPAPYQQQYGLNSPSSVPPGVPPVQMSFASTVPTVYSSSISAAPHQQQTLDSMSFQYPVPLVHNPLASTVPTIQDQGFSILTAPH